MRKIILFLVLVFSFFFFLQKDAFARIACSPAFTPSNLKAGDNNLFQPTNLKFTGDNEGEFSDGQQYYGLLISTDGGNCPENGGTGWRDKGCQTNNNVPYSSGKIEFQGGNLGGLSSLDPGKYTLTLCNTSESDVLNSCVPACNAVDVEIKTKSGSPPPPPPPGPGIGETCTFTTESDKTACSNEGHVKANCSKGWCDTHNPVGGGEGFCGEGKCTKCPTDGSPCYYDSPGAEPIVPNAPLSQPCKGDNPNGCTEIETAFGPVSTQASGFTRWLLGFLLSISGGIIILIIIISGYRLMTSSGDPEKVKNARDQLTAAIVGLLFIIFSLVILELITKDILGLPGFGSP